MAVLHPSFHVVIQVSCNPPKSIVRSGGKIRVIFVGWGRGLIFRFFLVVTAATFFSALDFFGKCAGGFPKNRRNAVCVARIGPAVFRRVVMWCSVCLGVLPFGSVT